MEKTKDILNYWQRLEALQPDIPKGGISVNTDSWTRLPWDGGKRNNIERYQVYLGVIGVSLLTKGVCGYLGIECEEDIEEDHENSTSVCAFLLDKEGRYIADSFRYSECMLTAVELIRESCQEIPDVETYLDGRRPNDKYAKARNDMKNFLNPYRNTSDGMQKDSLRQILQEAC